MSHAAQLLVDCLVRQGISEAQAVAAVAIILPAAVAAGLVQHDRLEAWERDARIYQLRGQRVTCVVLSQRFDLTRSKVFEAIRKHQKRRRAALGQAS